MDQQINAMDQWMDKWMDASFYTKEFLVCELTCKPERQFTEESIKEIKFKWGMMLTIDVDRRGY